MKSLMTVNLNKLKNIIPFYHTTMTPLYLWGPPSAGKTSAFREFAKEEAKRLGLEYSEDEFGPKYFTLKILTLSQMDSPDLRGMPEITKNDYGSNTQFVPTNELPRNGQGILFFDEMNLADDTTRAACYQLILDGYYGSLPPVYKKDSKGNILTDKWGRKEHAYWRVAASNREDDHCAVNATSLALSRRFAHLDVMPGVDEVIEYFDGKGYSSTVCSFLKSYKEDLFPLKYDEKLLENKANPFPSAWENIAILIDNMDLNKISKDKNMVTDIHVMAASCVGQATATKFVAFVRRVNKIDLDKFIKNPKAEYKKIEKSEDRPSLLYSICFSVSRKWKAKDKNVQAATISNILQVLPGEFSACLFDSVVKTQGRLNELMKDKGFNKEMTRLGRILYNN